MKDFGTTKRPENNADDPAARYRKTVNFVSRRPGSSGKQEAVVRLVGGIKIAAMYWFQSSGGKRFAITTPFFDEENESFIKGKCPIYDRSLVNPAMTWAMTCINRFKQREEHSSNPMEVFPTNKTEIGQLMDLHQEHGAPNHPQNGYDITTRKWKENGSPKCNIAIKMNMEGGSRTPLSEIEIAYPLYDLDLLYQPKEHDDYIMDVIKACLFSPEMEGYTAEDFKRDYDKYLTKDQQTKRERAFAGILKRYNETHEGGEQPQTDGRAPAMMQSGGAGTPAPAPMPHTPMPTDTAPSPVEGATAAPAGPAPIPPTTQETAPAPAPVPPATPASTATSTAPPAAATVPASEPPMPTPTAPSAVEAPPMPAPSTPATPASAPTPPPTPPANLAIPTAVGGNPALPPGMPDPNDVMNNLAPAPTGRLGSLDD